MNTKQTPLTPEEHPRSRHPLTPEEVEAFTSTIDDAYKEAFEIIPGVMVVPRTTTTSGMIGPHEGLIDTVSVTRGTKPDRSKGESELRQAPVKIQNSGISGSFASESSSSDEIISRKHAQMLKPRKDETPLHPNQLMVVQSVFDVLGIKGLNAGSHGDNSLKSVEQFTDVVKFIRGAIAVPTDSHVRGNHELMASIDALNAQSRGSNSLAAKRVALRQLYHKTHYEKAVLRRLYHMNSRWMDRFKEFATQNQLSTDTRRQPDRYEKARFDSLAESFDTFIHTRDYKSVAGKVRHERRYNNGRK